MKVHAVKLEYRRLKLEKMPHGHYISRKDKTIVVITYDPENAKYNSRHPRTLYVTSKLGKIYSEKINNYLRLKQEYDALLSDWNSRYRFAPPRIEFPIRQYYDPHLMNNDFYNKEPERS